MGYQKLAFKTVTGGINQYCRVHWGKKNHEQESQGIARSDTPNYLNFLKENDM